MSAGPQRGHAEDYRESKKAKRVTKPAAGSADQDTLLLAAQSGWGTTVRYGLLRALDRWPAAAAVLTSAGVGALVTSWTKALM